MSRLRLALVCVFFTTGVGSWALGVPVDATHPVVVHPWNLEFLLDSDSGPITVQLVADSTITFATSWNIFPSTQPVALGFHWTILAATANSLPVTVTITDSTGFIDGPIQPAISGVFPRDATFYLQLKFDTPLFHWHSRAPVPLHSRIGGIPFQEAFCSTPDLNIELLNPDESHAGSINYAKGVPRPMIASQQMLALTFVDFGSGTESLDLVGPLRVVFGSPTFNGEYYVSDFSITQGDFWKSSQPGNPYSEYKFSLRTSAFSFGRVQYTNDSGKPPYDTSFKLNLDMEIPGQPLIQLPTMNFKGHEGAGPTVPRFPGRSFQLQGSVHVDTSPEGNITGMSLINNGNLDDVPPGTDQRILYRPQAIPSFWRIDWQVGAVTETVRLRGNMTQLYTPNYNLPGGLSDDNHYLYGLSLSGTSELVGPVTINVPTGFNRFSYGNEKSRISMKYFPRDSPLDLFLDIYAGLDRYANSQAIPLSGVQYYNPPRGCWDSSTLLVPVTFDGPLGKTIRIISLRIDPCPPDCCYCGPSYIVLDWLGKGTETLRFFGDYNLLESRPGNASNNLLFYDTGLRFLRLAALSALLGGTVEIASATEMPSVGAVDATSLSQSDARKAFLQVFLRITLPNGARLVPLGPIRLEGSVEPWPSNRWRLSSFRPMPLCDAQTGAVVAVIRSYSTLLTPRPRPDPYDINADQTINDRDLLLLIGALLQHRRSADVNGDRRENFRDLLQWSFRWQSDAGTADPEP